MEKLALNFEHRVLDHTQAQNPEKFLDMKIAEKVLLSQPAPIFTPQYLTELGYTPKMIANLDGKASQLYYCKSHEGVRLDKSGHIVEHRIGEEHPIWGNDHVIEFEYDPDDGYLVQEEERGFYKGKIGLNGYETKYFYLIEDGIKVLDKMVLQQFAGAAHNKRGENVRTPTVIDFSDTPFETAMTRWEHRNFAL